MAKRRPNPTVPVVFPPALPDAMIQEAFDELVALHREATLEHGVRSGEVVVRRFFGGSLAAWRERHTGDASLRKLVVMIEEAGHPGLSPTGLYRCVEMYDLDCRVGVLGRKQLNARHVRAVIGLPDKVQETLLGRAEANDWMPERLEKEVARMRRRDPAATGRRPLPRFAKTMNALDRMLSAKDDAFAELDRVADLSDAQARRYADAAAAMKARCAAIESAMLARLAPKNSA